MVMGIALSVETNSEPVRNYCGFNFTTVPRPVHVCRSHELFHGIRTSHYSCYLGWRLGLSEESLNELSLAALYHDIGKQALPPKLLYATGELSKKERGQISQHAKLGFELLSRREMEIKTVIRTVALTHHEHWDGGGYPNGVKGKEIPLYSRIIAIADVFDALTSERCYKPAWSVESAASYIIQGRDSLFDPTLVEQFERTMPDILSIYRQDRSQVKATT
jgi:putative two-component system response regulator